MVETAPDLVVSDLQGELRDLLPQLVPSPGTSPEKHLGNFILDQDDSNVHKLAQLIRGKVEARGRDFDCVGGPASTANLILAWAVAGEGRFFNLKSSGQIIHPSLKTEDKVLLLGDYASDPDALLATANYCLQNGVTGLVAFVVIDGSAGEIAEAMDRAGIAYDYLLTPTELER